MRSIFHLALVTGLLVMAMRAGSLIQQGKSVNTKQEVEPSPVPAF